MMHVHLMYGYNNKITFSDVDECEDFYLNNCDQLCANTIGSYNCNCTDGYSLSTDEHTCLGKPKKIYMYAST